MNNYNIKLPSTKSTEITYSLNEEEMDSIANLTNVKVNELMVLASYKYNSKSQQVELYEYSVYSAKVGRTKWLKVAKELDYMLSSLLDETKIIDYIVEFETLTTNKFKENYIEVRHDEAR